MSRFHHSRSRSWHLSSVVSLFLPLWIFLVVTSPAGVLAAEFSGEDNAEFLAAWPQIKNSMYTEEMPTGASACVGSSASYSGTTKSISSNSSASQIGSICTESDRCVVAEGAVLTMDGSLNVGALVVRGKVQWDDSSQGSNTEQWLCAGYVQLEGNAEFILSVTSQARRAYIYIKNNGASSPVLGSRFFGGVSTSASAEDRPLIDLAGHERRRTWSQLARPAESGDTFLTLLHDIELMGWRVGDRLGLAPTGKGDYLYGETFSIATIGPAKNQIGTHSFTQPQNLHQETTFPLFLFTSFLLSP